MDIQIRQDMQSDSKPSILFAGDCNYSEYFNSGIISDSVQEVVQNANISVMNLEAPVVTDTHTNKWGPTNSQPTQSISTFSDCGFDIATLANNHTMDHGQNGLERTINACKIAGMEHIGAGDDIQNTMEPIYFSLGSQDVALFNFCDREFGVATENEPGVAWINHPGVERSVSETAEEVDLVFVVAHGGIEYIPLPPPSWQRKLRSLVDAGADAIISHHPHVAQGWEVYSGSPIFYSLGNFAYRISNRPATAWAFFVSLQVSDDGLKHASIYPVETKDGKVQSLKSRDLSEIENHLRSLSEVTSKALIEQGYWQEIALQLFRSKYCRILSEYGRGRLASLLNNPRYEIARWTRIGLGQTQRTQEKQLKLLNYIQNDSHRDVFMTALKLQTGVSDDVRNEEIKVEIEEYLQWADQRPDKGVLEQLYSDIQTLRSRL